jgi:hypothetical protein
MEDGLTWKLGVEGVKCWRWEPSIGSVQKG